jgi:GT2 family glycosyltransferase
MRASIIIASHNEGDLLANTIESCIETTAGMDYEIIVADDASTDGSAEAAARRFPMVRLHRNRKRQGASPTKHLGSQQARGEVFLFLDGHSKPEQGSLVQLARGVEETEGQAVITPRILALDTVRWKNMATQTGHGYAFDLRTVASHWVALENLKKSALGRGQFFESPALIGCALAVSRPVYERVWGFDPNMKFWGVEDLDFSLKCWLLGHPILHDPEAGVGHRFQESFDRYSVPMEHIVVNELRLAYKNFTHAVWGAWLEDSRERHAGTLPDNPEGLWAHAWELFKAGEDSAHQERSYLHARRERDEFWYAERFGLTWPQLMSTGRVFAAGASPSASPSGGPSPSGKPSPGPGKSPSPAPSLSITGPADVPGLTQYQYKIALGAGQTATGIKWTVDKPTATFVGATNAATVTVAFKNTGADWINLKATFTLNGKIQSAQKQIALVQVKLDPPVLANPGKVNSVGVNASYLVTPPTSAPPFVFTNTPGSDTSKFKYNGGIQAPEPGQRVNSNGGGGGVSFSASVNVTLTSPVQKPTAQKNIQVGFMQAAFDAGSATYATTPPGKKRVVTIPTTTSVDWLSTPPAANDDWPWYDEPSRVTGTGSGSCTLPIPMSDSPAFVAFPSQYNPNNAGDPNKNAALVSGNDSFAFTLRIGVRTLDPAPGANTHYFSEGQTTWTTNFVWPVTPAVSIVTTGSATWTVPAVASEISVNVVPTVTNHNIPFLRVIPQ